jgi:outer membrane protein assembly factor BamB
MAYRSKDLSALAYANGFTLWHYRTGDLAAEVDNNGYFNAAGRMLRVGGFILLNAGADAAATNGVLVVSANANGVVDVTNLTTFGAVNTD